MNLFRSICIILCLVGSYLLSHNALAIFCSSHGRPPQENPHPPQTPEDQKRVDFAKEAMGVLFLNDLTPETYSPNEKPALRSDIQPFFSYKNKSLSCLKNASCLKSDKTFEENLKNIKKLGKIVEIRHPHLIPWSMDQQNFQVTKSADLKLAQDEYVVHMYTQFFNSKGIVYGYGDHCPERNLWFHLDLILSENKKGEIFLRRLYLVPSPVEEEPPYTYPTKPERRYRIKNKDIPVCHNQLHSPQELTLNKTQMS